MLNKLNHHDNHQVHYSLYYVMKFKSRIIVNLVIILETGKSFNYKNLIRNKFEQKEKSVI